MLRAGIFIALLALIKTGSSIKCYVCSSFNNPSCEDPFPYTIPAVDCKYPGSSKNNVCLKVVYEDGNIERSCPVPIGNCEMLNALNSIVKVVQSCETCDTNNCNGTGSIAVSLPLATFALIASYLLFK